MAKSKSWQAYERVIASLFGTFRTPLSGINSRHGPGDILVPDDLAMLVECKCRANSLHLSMFEDACADAKKNKLDPVRTLLFFKRKHAHDSIVTMHVDMFTKIWNVPGVRELFKR